MASSRDYAQAFCQSRGKGMSEVNIDTYAFPLMSTWEADLQFICAPSWR